jgi:quercetin dioxygenase-like cupin family protein
MSEAKTLPNGLPAVKRFITDHNAAGKAVFSTANEETLEWQNVGGIKNFALGYATNNFPVKLDSNDDLRNYEQYLQKKPGIVVPGGTVLRYVDLAPGTVSPMHRTVSLDYGVVLEGQVEFVLDSGESRIMNRGDVAVQRATAHEWRNTSSSEWARLMFVLQESQPVSIGGRALGEDYGKSMPGVRPS